MVDADDLAGGEALRALLEHDAAWSLQALASESARPSAEGGRQEREGVQRAAVRLHGAIWGQPEDQARRQVEALTAQVVALARRAPWFADELLRTRALDEIVARTTRGEAVPSAEAQQAWVATLHAGGDFDVGGLVLPDPELIREAHIRPNAAEVLWLDRWQGWAEQA